MVIDALPLDSLTRLSGFSQHGATPLFAPENEQESLSQENTKYLYLYPPASTLIRSSVNRP
ncbi:MAG: hypothetical protein CL578_04515 [Alteromonadaceae bacterium]|uniref:Uncharacterized protein n=1 Tax=Paraglaciecola chathamensis S18K6 TaxID=1127672 RepID=A0AAV3UYW2_9ALTE|nr:hypothetical protein [Alteromonadaceae bacterium]GAC09944.1 hypothetical protein GCHA_1993 [Paraglaciecola chathamensis S18K6]